ncbi:MAG: polysaccharide deacetylase family protein [Planctomycetota bacterium]
MRRIVALTISLAYFLLRSVGDWLRQSAGRRRGECVILYYHGVTDRQRAGFERQMQWLARRRTIVPLAGAAVAGGAVRRTCVTFDDALDSVRRNAVPVLARDCIPATVFAVSGNMGRSPAWAMPPGHPDTYEVLMTVEQLRSLPAELIEIGSHTATHADLTALDDVAVRSELVQSKRELEAALGRPVTAFSVPYGRCPAGLESIAGAAGYQVVVTCEPEPVKAGSNPLAMGRFKVTPDDWTIEFRLKASGAYAWRRWIPRRRSPGVGSVAPETVSREAATTAGPAR